MTFEELFGYPEMRMPTLKIIADRLLSALHRALGACAPPRPMTIPPPPLWYEMECEPDPRVITNGIMYFVAHVKDTPIRTFMRLPTLPPPVTDHGCLQEIEGICVRVSVNLYPVTVITMTCAGWPTA